MYLDAAVTRLEANKFGANGLKAVARRGEGQEGSTEPPVIIAPSTGHKGMERRYMGASKNRVLTPLFWVEDLPELRQARRPTVPSYGLDFVEPCKA